MPEQQNTIKEIEEDDSDGEGTNNNCNDASAITNKDAVASRKERRKVLKREKRKKKRKEMAEIARREEEEEARLNNPEELLKLRAEEEQERSRFERERREFEERERRILEDWERRKAEEERRRYQEDEHQSDQNQVENEHEEAGDGWEYVEEGPPEIIWQGNEIIVKKKKIRVKKKDVDQKIIEVDPNRPTSNPLPPQSESFAEFKNTSILSAQQLLQNIAQETPNFGTEQDKAHCPFHLKTGACRFGSRCSRTHFYPDKSCTLLIKNMYNGPGLAWEQDEGLEYTDEEVERAYEEFYEDVHTEFLKFGEIVNFKVCRNGSPHLRGNVYVHYISLDSAVLAYQSVNGRYFAGKQVQCEFVGVTRWKVAICGEFMKSKLQTCSRGMTCNFIHCFRNPGGDYEWADWDKPPPRYWLKRMAALFGSDDSGYDKHSERESPRFFRNSSRTSTHDADRYHSFRSRSRKIDYSSSRNYSEDDFRHSAHRRRRRIPDREQPEVFDDKQCDDFDRNRVDRDEGTHNSSRNRRKRNSESRGGKSDGMSLYGTSPGKNMCDSDRENYDHSEHRRSRRHREKSYEIANGGCASSRGDYSNMDRLEALSQRGTSTSAGEQNKLSASPDDVRGSPSYSKLTIDWSDGERGSALIYAGHSSTSDSSEEMGDKKSRRRHAHKGKDSSNMDHLGRGNGSVDHDTGKPSNSSRSYRSSHSNSRCYSRKDTAGKEECGDEFEKQFPNHLIKSKRKRDTAYKSDSESRNEAKRFHATNSRIDESTTDIGDRWKPDKDHSPEHQEFDHQFDETY